MHGPIASVSQICVPRYETVTSMRLGKSDFESHILQELEENKFRSFNNKVWYTGSSGVQRHVLMPHLPPHAHPPMPHPPTPHPPTTYTRAHIACARTHSSSDTQMLLHHSTHVQVVSVEGSSIVTQEGYKESTSVSTLHSPYPSLYLCHMRCGQSLTFTTILFISLF